MLACWLLALSACAPAAVDPPATPPTTLEAAQVGGCFSASDCKGSEMCVDPRYPVCGAQPACEDGGLIQCGCACLARCTATSCGADEVCGAGGCCEPRSCSTDAQCGETADRRCVSGRCVRRGTCTLPPP
jgi:hypothetical protein